MWMGVGSSQSCIDRHTPCTTAVRGICDCLMHANLEPKRATGGSQAPRPIRPRSMTNSWGCPDVSHVQDYQLPISDKYFRRPCVSTKFCLVLYMLDLKSTRNSRVSPTLRAILPRATSPVTMLVLEGLHCSRRALGKHTVKCPPSRVNPYLRYPEL
jgi:hypothetical protein